MKVILLEDVKNVGKKGDIAEVAEGYGRNFLIKKNMAAPATAENVNVAKAKAGSMARKKAQMQDEAKLLAAQLEKVSVTIPVRMGEGGKIFGSVTGKDISDALKKQNIDIDKKKISLEGEVTGTGSMTAVIKVHPEITSRIRVEIVEA